jgi:hypothetical protein
MTGTMLTRIGGMGVRATVLDERRATGEFTAPISVAF